MTHRRVVSWFSCGAASAVATKLTVDLYPNTVIAYCDTASEHPDNKRFLADCEKWFDQKIIVLKSDKYDDIWDVFKKTKYLVGVSGARCTTELKKVLRNKFQEVDDLQVFGFTSEEKARSDRFRENNHEVRLSTPLIDKGISKQDCFNIIKEAGIELPMMYKLGYKNNNCIGCVKGQAGYWNKIRVDFPDVFERMANMEIEINAAINKSYKGDGIRKRIFLKDLPPDMGRYQLEPSLSCGVLCDDRPE